jgi:hypothetical protein
MILKSELRSWIKESVDGHAEDLLDDKTRSELAEALLDELQQNLSDVFDDEDDSDESDEEEDD